MNDDRTPNLLPVIQWLEAGCDPKHAAAELRIYAERLAALSAAPAQEPVAWRETALAFERRAMRVEYIIRMLVAAGHVAQEKVNEAFSIAKGFASPLPQEPQEMKALTDADAGLTAAWKVLHDETIPASNRYVRAIKAHRMACGSSLREAKDAVDCLQSGRVRPSERELRGAQEGEAGEDWKRRFAELGEPTRLALMGASIGIEVGAHALAAIKHDPDQWLCFRFNTWDEVAAALRAVKAWDSAGYLAKDAAPSVTIASREGEQR